jgi:hypothetical protein
MSLGVVGDRFFSFFPKIMDWEGLLDTLGDALTACNQWFGFRWICNN